MSHIYLGTWFFTFVNLPSGVKEMIGFESFWGSAASMELNARETRRADNAAATAHAWANRARDLEQQLDSMRSHNAALACQLSDLSIKNEQLEMQLALLRRKLVESQTKVASLNEDKRRLIDFAKLVQAVRQEKSKSN